MKDNQIITTIDDLVAEEHQLREQHEQAPLNEDGLNRLRVIEESLDQCWDLLRQRRARREYGQNPDQAAARSRNVVEGYRQ
ncbi:MAG TPA: DUF2630 family protein [Acidimicrobiales bacterium]|nr:DUF2630 family protein [Acidimicrobiales bacterium]